MDNAARRRETRGLTTPILHRKKTRQTTSAKMTAHYFGAAFTSNACCGLERQSGTLHFTNEKHYNTTLDRRAKGPRHLHLPRPHFKLTKNRKRSNVLLEGLGTAKTDRFHWHRQAGGGSKLNQSLLQ